MLVYHDVFVNVVYELTVERLLELRTIGISWKRT